MKDNLCAPCTSDLVERITAKAKYLRYKNQRSNLSDLVENEYFKKNCRPNFQEEMGNNNWETATDRFNKEDYSKMINNLMKEEALRPPELEDIDETLNLN